MSRILQIAAIIGSASCVFLHAVAAQTVTGQVVDSLSKAPLSGGFVVLLDERESEIARTLTTSEGNFQLRAPRAGTYQLRSERIGYRVAVSPPIAIPAGSPVSYTFEIAPVPFLLNTVEVRSETQCEVNPERAAATVHVWEEIRKALAATAWDGTQELARYRKYNYERDLTGSRRRITREDGQVVEGATDQPYTSLPAARLARDGYIVPVADDELLYALPDANVLLDDAFLSTHCFHVVRDAREQPGQVGLAFVPVRGQNRPDVQGTLWLDESSSELRVLEVSFTKLPGDLEDDRAGGTVEFLRLPTGAWIIQRWELRTPMVRVERRSVGLRDRGGVPEPAAIGWRDFGGEVLEVAAPGHTTIYPGNLSHLTGTVTDSTRNGPLVGANVTVAGTLFSSETDTAGTFHITAPLEGEYSLTLSHPWLDSISYQIDRAVELARGSTKNIALDIPHARAWLARLCPDSPDTVETGAVVGVARAADGHAPAAKAIVTGWWQTIISRARTYVGVDWEATSTADEDGKFVLCQIPTGREVMIHAALGGDTSSTAHVILPTSEGRELLFAWDRRRGEAFESHLGREHSLWTVDFTLGESGADRATETGSWLSGRVTDENTGRGVDAVRIVLNGRDTASTRNDGTFDLVGIEFVGGVNLVTFARLGYRRTLRGITLAEGQRGIELTVSLQSSVLTLEPVEVTGEALDRYLEQVGFHDRQKVNRGYFLDRSDIDGLLGRVSSVVEMVSTLPNMGRLGIASIDAQSGCTSPLVFIDGFRLDTPFGINSTVRPEEVYAVEVYRTPSQVPPQFGGAESGCGVILFWTRRGG